MSACARKNHRCGFTLLELLLVVGLVAAVAAFVIPNFARQIKGEALPTSANQLRSLLTLVAANASFDGKRYRIRFPTDDETDPLGGNQQPLIERENDPIRDPEVFDLVTAPWAIGDTLIGDIRCAEVRLQRPTIQKLQDLQNRGGEEISDVFADREEMKDFGPLFPPLYFEPDGTTEWAVFVVTDAPSGVQYDELEDYKRIEVILEGQTGFCWLQRPLYEAELDLFEEKGWPAVLRQDFLNRRELTEDDILELREIQIKQ